MDISRIESFDLDALHAELKNRREQVHNIKESMKWAIKEHENQIQELLFAIKWKEKQNGKHK